MWLWKINYSHILLSSSKINLNEKSFSILFCFVQLNWIVHQSGWSGTKAIAHWISELKKNEKMIHIPMNLIFSIVQISITCVRIWICASCCCTPSFWSTHKLYVELMKLFCLNSCITMHSVAISRFHMKREATPIIWVSPSLENSIFRYSHHCNG